MKTKTTRSSTGQGPAEKIRSLFWFLLLSVIVAEPSLVWSQSSVPPSKYWTFNGTNPATDSMGVSNLDFTTYGSQYTVGNSGQVGKFMTFGTSTNGVIGGPLVLTNGVTIEFLFKPGPEFNRTTFMYRSDYAFAIEFDFMKIKFSTSYKTTSGSSVDDVQEIYLSGIGRKSHGYYVDGNWHHLVFRMDASTGAKQIWVDGQLPSDFSKTLTPGVFQNTGNNTIFINSNVGYVKYFGSIDELALYNSAIPHALIYKHYLGVQNGTPYSFTNNYSGTIPSADPVSGPVDVNEFAIGHPNPTQSVITQVKNYPVPRYKPGHTLLPNVNWMNPMYMGGWMQPGVTQQQAWNNGDTIQVELARNFNYYFNVELGGTGGGHSAANANPDLKLSLILHRYSTGSLLTSGSLPNDHYLQNSSGQFLDVNGNLTTNKIWRPTAPPSSYAADGNTMRSWVNNMFNTLNRDIDLVNENGEIFPVPTVAAMTKDPQVTAAKNASGLGWTDFLARKMMENETQAYRNIIMGHPRLANAKFTEYDIDGYRPSYTFEYIERRKVNSLINGQYYSTPSFYPRWPDNWRYWSGPWHGWQWMVESRVNELALGDRLYSPFIAAGWNAQEDVNIRPAQWLGLLKVLAITGAEFYYTGFFNLSAPWPDAKNWVWQSVMPAYAQGVTSRIEDILRNGDLMTGDVPNSYTNPTGPGYSFKSGDLRKLVVVRKHNSLEKYAITGTLQPFSNMLGSAENEGVAQIVLNGTTLKFKVRRQGNTYVYDKTNPAEPVFYLLDGWHEKTHPSRWSQDFNIEGELFDNINTQVTIKTSVPSGTPAGDYTNFTSYITWPDNATNLNTVEYNFQPRNSGNSSLYLWVRARSRGGVTTSMNVQFDNTTAKTIGCISDTAWTWYRYDACTQQPINIQGATIGKHTLKISPSNPKLEIDQIILTTNSNLGLNTAPPSCGSATATVTASGNTTFCQGGNVTLTANSGTSYLWSPGGQTTQSITVSSAGNYQVTVGSGTGCAAISNPVAVSILPAPSAVITAGGSTTICPGNTVTLSATAGAAAYLWMPGLQTTQSITTGIAGSYTVRLTGANGCTATSSPVTVTTGTVPVANITPGGATTFCQGGNVTLTSSAANGYLWFPGGQTTQSITVSASGSYTVRVTGTGGCTATSAPTTVTVNPLPSATISASGSTSICAGGTVTLTSSSGAAYLWSPGGQTTQSITTGTAGSYTVRVTSAAGCSATSSAANVTVSALPTATITAGGPTTFCSGGSVTLTSSPGNSYLWTPGGQTTSSISATASGSYTVRVTNAAGCSATSAATSVNESAPVTATITPDGPTTFQAGQTVTLTASGGSSYSWSPGGQTTSSIVVGTSGTYTVTAFDASGCSGSSAPVTVTVMPVTGPPATITTSNGTTGICSGTPLTLTASTGASYLWSPGGQTTQSIVVNNPGTYEVEVTDATGTMVSTASVDITLNPAPDVPAIISSYIPGSSYQLMAYEPTAHTYLWSTGATTQTITVSANGNYTVTATNGLGCVSPPRTMSVNTVSPQPCIAPNMLMHYGITKTEAVLHWNPAITADSFRVEYTRVSTGANVALAAAGNVNKVELSGLYEGETYKWSVKAICNGNYYQSAIMQFNTLSGPLPCGSTPQYLTTDRVNATVAIVSWFDTQADKFVIRYRPVGSANWSFRHIYTSLTTGTIMGLTPTTTYEWSVRSMCGSNYSLFSDPEYFTTLPVCPSIGTVSVVDVGFNKAKLTWNAGVSVDTIMIRYAVSGTTNYQWIKRSGNPGEYFIPNLAPETTYDAWVSTKCGSGSTSMWGQGVTFTTLPVPPGRYTEEAGSMHLNAYPNPARNHIGYVFESDDNDPYSVKVCDMAGRELYREERVASEGLTDGKVNLPGYSPGLYMLVVQKGPSVGRFKFNISD